MKGSLILCISLSYYFYLIRSAFAVTKCCFLLKAEAATWGVLKKGVLRNFTQFTGRHLCQRLFFNKAAGVKPVYSERRRLWHRCFPVNFVKFLRAPFLQNTSGRGLLFTGFLKVFFKKHGTQCRGVLKTLLNI